VQIDDAAKRVSDAVNLAVFGEGVGKWMAFGLSDGRTDNVLYDSRYDAVDHQLSAAYYLYVRVAPGGMQPREASALLGYWRQLHDAGGRFHDPGFAMPLMPLTGPDQKRQIQVLVKGR
jgi:hypothetical protein